MIATACGREFEGVSDEELHRRARQLPLEERYEFYLRERRDQLPPKHPTLAVDVAALGEPAWHYTIARASGESYHSLFWTALPVLDEFDRKCTVAEHKTLMRVALTAPVDEQKLIVGALNSTCRWPASVR